MATACSKNGNKALRSRSTRREQTKQKFEAVGKRELLVQVPLAMVEVWEEMQGEHLTGLICDRRNEGVARGD